MAFDIERASWCEFSHTEVGRFPRCAFVNLVQREQPCGRWVGSSAQGEFAPVIINQSARQSLGVQLG